MNSVPKQKELKPLMATLEKFLRGAEPVRRLREYSHTQEGK